MAMDIRTEEEAAEAVRQNGRPMTERDAMRIVGMDGWDLRHVPEEMKTPAVCMAAVRQDGWALKWVPGGLKTKDMCMEAVKQFGMTLQCVPEDLKTAEVCAAACAQDARALQFVPEGMHAGLEPRPAEGTAVPAPAVHIRTEDLPDICARFAEAVAGAADAGIVPQGCSPRLDLERLDGGGLKCGAGVAAPDGTMVPVVSAVYRPKSRAAGRGVDAGKALASFIGKIERDCLMRADLKEWCIAGIRQAAGIPEPEFIDETEHVRPCL